MEFGAYAQKFLSKILQLFLKTNTWVLRKVYVFIAVTERWFTLNNRITHMPWDFKYGRVRDCAFYILVFIFPQQHHILPVKSYLFSFHCLHFYRPTCSQAKAFFVLEWELGNLPKARPRKLVWPLFLCPASAPHILLTISSQSPATSCFTIIIIIILSLLLFWCFVFFSRKHSVMFKPSFHIPKALFFVDFIVDSFSLHFFSSVFLGSFPVLRHI